MEGSRTPEELKELGNNLFKKRKYVEALRAYDDALAKDDAFMPAIYNKAMTLLKLDLADEAMVTVKKGLEFSPDNDRLISLKKKADKAVGKNRTPGYFKDRGNEFFKVKRYEEAISAYDKAIEIKKDYVPALVNKAKALEKLERLDEAYELIIESAAIAPADPNIIKAKKVIEAHIGKRDLKTREPEDQVSIGMKHLADNLFMREQLLQAIAKYDVALGRTPDYTSAWFNKGQTLRKLKNYIEAQECFGKARELAPGNPIIGQALETVATEIGEAKSIEASMMESEKVYEDALSKIDKMLERTKDIDKDYDKIMGMVHEAEGVIETGSKYADMDKPRKMVKAAMKMLADDNYPKAEAFAKGAKKKAAKVAAEGKEKYELATKEIEYVEKTVREMMDAGVGIPQVRALQDQAEEEVFRKNFVNALEIAKRAHKMALEEAEKALVILKTTDKEYAQASQRMAEAEKTMEDARGLGVGEDVKEMYEHARKAFEEGDYISAEVYAKMAIEGTVEIVEDVRSGYEGVEAEMRKVEELMEEVADAGVDLSQSRTALDRAQSCLDSGDLDEASKYARLAYTATMKIVEETLNDIKIEGGAYKDTIAVIKATEKTLKAANEVGDVSELEEALQEAYAQLDDDNYFKAMGIATEIMDAAEGYAEERRELKEEALRRMAAVETALDRFKGRGVDMSSPESMLNSARSRIDAKEFETALELIEEANETAKRAAEKSLRSAMK